MITFPENPIEVYIEGLGEAWVIYVKDCGMGCNDEITVALKESGQWRHVNSSQVKSVFNATYSIQKKPHIEMQGHNDE